MPYGHQQRLAILAASNNIPLDVSLELTHSCNFRCQHCYIPDFSAPDLLSTDRILRLLEELAEIGTMYLTLTGGELFLRHDWLTVARRARRLGFAVRLFSNGSRIDEAVADAVAALPAATEISLYSMTRATFEEITQRPGSFDKTLRGTKLLRQRDVEVTLKTPMMVHNFRDMDEIAIYAESIGAAFQPSPVITAKKNGDLATIALRVPQQEIAPHFGGLHLGCEIADDDPQDPRREGPLCAAANRYCNITSAGDVMACNILPGSDSNIRQRSFRDVWENSPWLEKIRSIRRSDLHSCRTCSSLPYCGRCHAQAMVEDGDLYGPSSYARERAEIIDQLNGIDADSAGRDA